MNGFFKSIAIAAGMSVALATASAASPEAERQELMKTVVKSLKSVIPMAKGEAEYDAAAAKAAMEAMNAVPDKFVLLFPEGSTKEADTEASPKIWENFEDFKAKANELKTASASAMEAADKGQEAFKAALFGPVTNTCKGCHEAYRIKKE